MGKALELLRKSEAKFEAELKSFAIGKTVIQDTESEVVGKLKSKVNSLEIELRHLRRIQERVSKRIQIAIQNQISRGEAIDDIQKVELEVCDYFGVMYANLFKRGRKGDIIFAKHIVRFLFQVHFKNGPSACKRRYNVDHATCLHSKRVVQNWYMCGMPESIIKLINRCCGFEMLSI